MKSKGMLLGLLAAFLFPTLLANLAFRMDWFEGGQTNRGELVPAGVQLSLTDDTWRLLVVPDSADGTCAQACQNAAYVAEQVRLTLGREIDRVSLLTLDSPTAQDWQRLQAQASGSQLYILDPDGNLVLRYPALAERDAMLEAGRGMQKDLKRLLKYSRAG